MNNEIYYIEDNCTRCGACVPICPAQCIYYGLNQFVIDSDRCISCGLCKSVCKDAAIETKPNDGS